MSGRKLVRLIFARGALHLALIAAICVFILPFLYLLGTSFKTDEELFDNEFLPRVPRFEAVSPRVRVAGEIVKPAEAPQEKWDVALPLLREKTRGAVDAVPLPAGGELVDGEAYRVAATDFLLNRSVARVSLELWNGPTEKLLSAYEAGLNADAIAAALDDRLARFEIRGLQARTLDSHMFALTPGADVAGKWTVESGDARFIPAKDAAVVRYAFKKASDDAIILRCEFDYPADPEKLHKLIFAIRPDDSWQRVSATLDLNGVRWVSQKTKYLGTHRRQSILFQLPSFDDTTDRKRIWVPMKSQNSDVKSSSPRRGTLRVIVSPSSTPTGIWGKIRHNYRRAFESVPFWRYVRNSLIVVVLTTLGTLFSASFVAYAFARLHWPGRTVALGILLSTMMLPEQVTFIPTFMVWRTLGLYNTLAPLWLPAWLGTAFFIFLMTQHMKTIPRELEEAARIDGAGALRTWWQIILPQCTPALAAIAILSSMAAWNEFLKPLIYLRDQQKFPLSLGLYGLRLDNPQGGIDWTMIMAGNVMMTIPVVVIFFLFQRYFIQGMTMSGVKG